LPNSQHYCGEVLAQPSRAPVAAAAPQDYGEAVDLDSRMAQLETTVTSRVDQLEGKIDRMVAMVHDEFASLRDQLCGQRQQGRLSH